MEYVLDFQEIDRTLSGVVGGKGAHLAELSRVEGISVPSGYCVTTEAFRRIMATAPSIAQPIDRLSELMPDERESIGALSAEIRGIIEGIAIPEDLAAAITGPLSRLGEQDAYAVRSSATAEDLPTASFAGQHDTFLNVVGPEEILRHVSRCWASLFTERAVTYRLRNGFDHRTIRMAVVVQRMVTPHASGILFTADPVTGNRKVASVEAVFGLGEALVSGLVNADGFKVRDGEVIDRALGTMRVAIHASPAGGTHEQQIEPERQDQPVLTSAHAVRLVQIGRRIEAHFGSPQDVEWCLIDDEIQIVQSRPITTLFPVPDAGDAENHVYVSVGHQQMMTDAMKPLGLSMWQLAAGRPMYEAGGRVFVDVTPALASPASRTSVLDALGKSDPLIRDALQTILDRGDFVPTLPEGAAGGTRPAAGGHGGAPVPMEPDTTIVEELIEHSNASLATLKREIGTRAGAELLDFILWDMDELKRILFDPRSHQVITMAVEATWWLNERLGEWLGEKNAADALTQSVPYNVTSEMGLALLDVADAIRPHPHVVEYLQHVRSEDFLNELPALEGGGEARDAILEWLDRFGMRCVGEIDITRTRWSERPSSIVPLILGNIRNFEPGAAKRRFDQGRREAREKEAELLERVRALPEGEQKAAETRQMIDRVRAWIGYREYPKYGMISRFFVYKLALLREADNLVATGVLREREDIFYLTFRELNEVVRTHQVHDQLIRRREEAFKSYQSLRPPRVLTSDGEAIAGSYRRGDLPAGSLAGLSVSAGTVEGRARIILDLAQADVEAGDILVTPFTDPSWTPLFVAVAGLVTEVGGVMTHGAVIAREYGLPAVVGVEHATRRIRDGQRIRVHGTEGFVELL